MMTSETADAFASITHENRLLVCTWEELGDRQPHGVLLDGVDLVVVRFDQQVSVLMVAVRTVARCWQMVTSTATISSVAFIIGIFVSTPVL